MDNTGRRLPVLAMGKLCFPTPLTEHEVARIAEMQDLIGSCIFRVARLTGEFILVLFILLGERDSNTGKSAEASLGEDHSDRTEFYYRRETANRFCGP